MPNSKTWEELIWAFSPCPNDTFIFDALVHHRIPEIPPINTPTLLDIDYLNQAASHHKFDVIKISAAHYINIQNEYDILNSGCAMGFGVGPLLIAKNDSLHYQQKYTVGIPGEDTTAAFLLKLFFAPIITTKTVLFSQIANHVLIGDYDMGLLIHEGRFTYKEKNLVCLADLGQMWEERYGLPLPLGLICVKKNLKEPLKQQIDLALQQSVKYAKNNPEKSMQYINENAAELNPQTQQSHINLYVNDFSINMGMTGKTAISTLLALQKIHYQSIA